MTDFEHIEAWVDCGSDRRAYISVGSNEGHRHFVTLAEPCRVSIMHGAGNLGKAFDLALAEMETLYAGLREETDDGKKEEG